MSLIDRFKVEDSRLNQIFPCLTSLWASMLSLISLSPSDEPIFSITAKAWKESLASFRKGFDNPFMGERRSHLTKSVAFSRNLMKKYLWALFIIFCIHALCHWTHWAALRFQTMSRRRDLQKQRELQKRKNRRRKAQDRRSQQDLPRPKFCEHHNSNSKCGIFDSGDYSPDTGSCSTGTCPGCCLLKSDEPNYGSIPARNSEKYGNAIDLRRRHHNRSYIRRIFDRVESFLMLQSSTMLGTDNGTFITIIILLGINLFIIFYKTLGEHPMIIGFRLGMVSVANLPLLFMLGCKHSPITFLIGWSYEQLNIFHRHLGRICVITALGHMVVFMVYFNWNYLLNEYYLQMGFLAGISFLLIGITSVRMARNRNYELMYFVHFLGIILSLYGIYYHVRRAKPYAFVSAGCITYDRIMRLLFDYRITQCCLRIENGNTIIIKVPKSQASALQSPNKWPLLSRLNVFFGRPLPRWKPGQHVYLSIPSIGPLQSHPFSIGSNYDYNKDGTLDLIVRVREGFTKKLMDNLSKELVNNFPGEQVWKWCILNGPYGIEPNDMPTVDSLLVLPQSVKQNIILVSGGAGISYTYPLLLEYLNNERLRQRQNESIDSKQISPKSTHTDYTYQQQSENIPNIQVFLFWIVPNRSFVDWVDFNHYQDKLNECLDGNSYGCNGRIKTRGIRVKLKIWVTAELGRPDVEMELRDMISRDDPRITINSCTVNSSGDNNDDGCARIESARKSAYKQVNSWIGVCGPERLVRNCRNTTAKLKAEGLDNIDFYAEKFGW